MEQLLTGLIENSSFPAITALALGLLTAISPCPLATNITAIGFISKEITEKNKVFIKGLVYALGRSLSYTLLAIIIYAGADQFKISGLFQQYGEKFIGPVLLIIGLVMLDVLRIKFPAFASLTKKIEEKSSRNYWDVLLLGVIFALAFCPYSAVLYFGMLIPMTITSVYALYLPLIFAIATALPVIVISWLLAYTVSGAGQFFTKMKSVEIWFRRVVAVSFVVVGVYYIVIMYV